MIWTGIAAGFWPKELLADRSAEAALAGETASAAAANATSSFNLSVMGDPWRGRQRYLVARKRNYVQNGHRNCHRQRAFQTAGSANWRSSQAAASESARPDVWELPFKAYSQAGLSNVKISCALEDSTNNLG